MDGKKMVPHFILDSADTQTRCVWASFVPSVPKKVNTARTATSNISIMKHLTNFHNFKDPFKNHLVLHVHCDLCVHESKSSEILGFWETVCNFCGKKFETQGKKENHMYKHQETEKECEYCDKIFRSTYTYQRHLNEQHQVHQHANNGPFETGFHK